jgi:hypothetical protein
MRTLLLVAAAMLIGSCTGAPATSHRRCLLFQDVDKTRPAGGVPIGIDVPREWTQIDYEDGACGFRTLYGAEGMIRVHLQFCLESPELPCDGELAGKASLRKTDELTLLGQTMRTSELEISYPRSHDVVECSAVVQGKQITKELADRLTRLDRICDTMRIEPEPSR